MQAGSQQQRRPLFVGFRTSPGRRGTVQYVGGECFSRDRLIMQHQLFGKSRDMASENM